jgi:hypothetical protein
MAVKKDSKRDETAKLKKQVVELSAEVKTLKATVKKDKKKNKKSW